MHSYPYAATHQRLPNQTFGLVPPWLFGHMRAPRPRTGAKAQLALSYRDHGPTAHRAQYPDARRPRERLYAVVGAIARAVFYCRSVHWIAGGSACAGDDALVLDSETTRKSSLSIG